MPKKYGRIMAMNGKISDLRNYYGLTQREIARRVGISSTAMSAIERGTHEPKVSTALRIARELGTTVEELWGEKGEESIRRDAYNKIGGYGDERKKLRRKDT